VPKVILGLGAALLLVLAGLALWLDLPMANPANRDNTDQKIDVTAGTIYSARFSDTDGNEQMLGQWQHRLLIINFWATWCTPCKEEMPMLAKMQKKYQMQGLQIVGIAVDSRANVVNFSQNFIAGYPLLPDEARAIEFSKRLGNRLGLLPFTVVVQPGGAVIFTRTGIISEADFIDLIGKNLLK
jgi:thiol-disulfide isomerase/thioredoxin